MLVEYLGKISGCFSWGVDVGRYE